MSRVRWIDRLRTLQVRILVAFLGVLILSVVTVSIYSYRSSEAAVRDMGFRFLSQVNRNVQEKVAHYLGPAATLSQMVSRLNERGTFSLTGDDWTGVIQYETK